MSIAVTNRSFNTYRTGANLSETILTQASVAQKGIKQLFSCPLPGDLRGSEGSALIVPGLTMSDGEVHDVLYIASMSDDVRAFDANTPNPETGNAQLLWKQRVGNPVKGTKAMDMYLINDFWGVLSTPVINLATNTIYVVAMSSPDGLIADSQFYLHALDLISGKEQSPPLNLNGATYTSPAGKVSKLGNVPRKQRCALAFRTYGTTDVVIIENGSFNEDADTNQGWVIACNVNGVKTGAAMKVDACFTTTSPPYSGGGLWMGSQGPALDDVGFIYSAVGNGDFDGTTAFGETMLKMQYTPGTTSTPGSIKPVSWFAPFTDTGRIGLDPTLATAPDDADNNAPGGTSNMDSPGDEDLNSGGMGYIPKLLSGFTKNLIHIAGKDGIWYLLDADNMGQTKNSDFAPANIQTVHYPKLLINPPWAVTYYPGGMSTSPTNLALLQTTYGGYTHHMHATPVVYKSPNYEGLLLYFGGENGPVRAYQLTQNLVTGAFTMTYLAQGAEIASAEVPPPGGMPGTMITLSANGAVAGTGILWCCQPYGNANNSVTDGRLIAYAADKFVNGALVKLWDSQDWAVTFKHCKFNIPVAANGKVYVPTYQGEVLVFGLAG